MISCFQLWNKIVSLPQSHNQCQKFAIFWCLLDLLFFDWYIALYSLQQGQIRRLKQSVLRPLFLKGICRGEKSKTLKYREGTVLVPMISVPTVPSFSRTGFSIGRNVTELFLPWLSDERDGRSQVLKMMIHLVVIRYLDAIASMVT